jgi:hypothetical protein
MFLNQYSDFVTEIISDAGSWPDGCSIEFRFQPSNTTTWTTWPATITGATASWDVLPADVATLVATQTLPASSEWIFGQHSVLNGSVTM